MGLNNIDVYGMHVDSVELVVSAGGQVPAEWTRTKESYEEKYLNRSDMFTLRLVESIVDAGSTSEDVSEFRAITLADAVAGTQGTAAGNAYGTASAILDTEVRRSIAGKLISQYDKVSEPNLKVVAKAFDAEWKRFTELASKVDPEISPDQLIGKPMDVQTAWLEIAGVAQRLDYLLNVLGEALNMASTLPRVKDSDSALGLILSSEAKGVARKRVWDAWHSTGRCGRWPALLALGETVKAVDTAKSYTKYGQYQGVIEKHERVGYGMRPYHVDAETGERVND
jgi:hypothetical protein